ncbi:NADP-dependent oxidoreductase [Subtercola endophyticus]|uniref:NADP-dependent oxidoreductase n=1 Tax=Subtercola endophyticus TaxID=2895559 RepID=UPI001E60FA1C|nr:NADP-dependent oxidoreductase [Subtercola endophyticus]UFS60921.1 NADP-dependent oxidoreductase [Subtercola endophyticus]
MSEQGLGAGAVGADADQAAVNADSTVAAAAIDAEPGAADSMFAVQYAEFGPPEVLTAGRAAQPHAEAGQVRIAVRAAGVAPVDLSIRSGRSPSASRLTLPHIPGMDAAGVVDEIGPGVQGVALGDEVFGSVDIAKLGGASAEFAVLSFWAKKPAALPWAQAGASGSSIETAARALDLLGIAEGTTLLIDGAAGGVGSAAVQLALARGARVIGTASPANQSYLASLGAEALTYGPGLPARVATLLGAADADAAAAPAASAQPGTIDRALHVSGADALPELIALTGSPDAVVTLSDFTGPSLGVRVSVGEIGGEADGRHGLATAAALATQGRFHVRIERVLPFEQAAEAHAAVAAHSPRSGKIVLVVPGEPLR